MNSVNLKTIEILKNMKVNDGITLYDQLLSIFESETPNHVVQLREAIEKMNFEKINFVSHTLKSSCMTIGLENAAAICQELEKQSANNLSFNYAVRFELLILEIEQGLSFLKQK